MRARSSFVRVGCCSSNVGLGGGGGGGSGSSNLMFKSLNGFVQLSPSGSSGFSCCWRFFFDMVRLSKKSIHADIAGREECVEFVHQLIVDGELLHKIVEFLHGDVEGGNRAVCLTVIDDEGKFAFVFV